MLVTIFKIDIGSLIVQDWVFGLQQVGARQAVNQGGGEDGPSSARTLPPAHHLEPCWPPFSSDKVQPVTPSLCYRYMYTADTPAFWFVLSCQHIRGVLALLWKVIQSFVVLLLFFALAPQHPGFHVC